MLAINEPANTAFANSADALPTMNRMPLPEQEQYQPATKSNKSFLDKLHQKSQSTSVKDFVSNTLVKWTTGSSALVNLISSPIRLLKDDSIPKKVINNISMFLTRFHLSAYSVAGLISAFEQKNPLLIFSFFIEGVAAFCGLRTNYLFRGIGTGVDGAVAGVKDKHKKSNFSSYSEGWNHFWGTVFKSSKDLINNIKKSPFNIFKLDGNDIAIFSSLIASLGGIFGMTVNEKAGGAVRDIFGGIGDYGIFKLDNPIAKSSGLFYMLGSILDLSARIFNKNIATLLSISNIDAFERLRDTFHEAAIAFDRLGQYFFLRYNQQDDTKLQTLLRPLPYEETY